MFEKDKYLKNTQIIQQNKYYLKFKSIWLSVGFHALFLGGTIDTGKESISCLLNGVKRFVMNTNIWFPIYFKIELFKDFLSITLIQMMARKIFTSNTD